MIQIRNNVFETNSSSTHVLALNWYYAKDYLMNYLKLLRSYDNTELKIKPIEEIGEEGCFKTIEEKLRYLWTALCMNPEIDIYLTTENEYIKENLENSDPVKFLKLLKKVFPKVEFLPPENPIGGKGHYLFYSIEDLDWFFSGDFDLPDPLKNSAHYHKFWDYCDLNNEDFLRLFMERGIIIYYNRDNEYLVNKYKELGKENIIYSFEG